MLGTALRAGSQQLQSGRQLVAHALELTEIEQAGTTAVGATRRRGRGDEREALGEDRRELVLEARDLHPQGRAGSELGLDPIRG